MCGLTALISNSNTNGLEIYESLLSIQHRGQDGGGICCINNGNTEMIKDKGLLFNIFSYDDLNNMKGNIFLGHTRYKTNSIKDSFQPFNIYNDKLDMCFCHNGNVINTDYITDILKDKYKITNKEEVSDSYLLFQVIFFYLNDVFDKKITPNDIIGLSNFLHTNVVGSYSIILSINNYGLVILKDKFGIRPLIYGKNSNNDILISSESCSLNNVLNYEIINEVNEGETIVFTLDKQKYKYQYPNSILKPCLFEYIYFSRLDSIVNKISIYNCRYKLGELLGINMLKEKKNIDFIIPTPETSRVYAYGMSKKMNIPIQECIIKNRYINRTFIIENKKKISKDIKRKFSVIREIVKNKSVILLDDSVVRGNTSRNIIKLLKEAGVKRVIFCSAAPKIYGVNKYGIYIEKKEELITYKHDSNNSIAFSIGADKIYYNSLEDVVDLINKLNPNIKDMEASMFLKD